MLFNRDDTKLQTKILLQIMLARIFALVILLSFIASSVKGLDLFVTPFKTCGSSCSGSLTDPYDNLLIALQRASNQASTTIFLLNDITRSHYILQTEYTSSSDLSFAYIIEPFVTVPINDVLIKPLFCDEQPALSNPSLASKCITKEKKITVYLKATQFSLNILSRLQIQNIVFDASQDIFIFNRIGSQLLNCIYSRIDCCKGRVPPTSSPVVCYSGWDPAFAPQQIFSLFNLVNPDLSNNTPVSFHLKNTDFLNFLSPSMTSLITTGHNSFNLQIENSIIDGAFFDRGFIYHSSQVSINSIQGSKVNITNMLFTNYNPMDILRSDTPLSEGYLFITDDYFAGKFLISNSRFINASSSVLDLCPDLTTVGSFVRPMTNALFDPDTNGLLYARSDLWSQVHYDHIAKLTSSLIFMKELNGNLSIVSSTFQNIIGTSGSVLHVENNDLAARYNIINSTFDGNYAIIGFPNIFIVKATSSFPELFDCPKLNIVNSVFKNAYGCPGNYGNNIYLCYWDSSPDVSSSSLDTSAADPIWANLESYVKKGANDNSPYVTIRGSTFENNIASISNSLAIIGSPYTVLESNFFEHNGGTTAEILKAMYTGTYLVSRYSDRTFVDGLNYDHFGQSTVVYFDRVIKIDSINNQYIGNWGPWEGSFALGECLTIKNWIRIAGTLNFEGDSYINHQGIPEDVGLFISDSALSNNLYRSPLITFSYNNKGSTITHLRFSDITLTDDININMNNITFYNNSASYDSTSFDYNSDVISKLISAFSSDAFHNRLATGLIKFLTISESTDIAVTLRDPSPGDYSLGFTLNNSIISENKLLSSGCLFMTQWISPYIILNTQTTANQVIDEPITLSDKNSSPDLSGTNSFLTGVFRIVPDGTLDSTTDTEFSVSNITVTGNKGAMFYLAPSNNAVTRINNSLFTLNECLQIGLINVIRSQAVLFTEGNTFTENSNALGNIFVYSYGRYFGTNTTYIRNNGLHASLVFAAEAMGGEYVKEIYTKAYSNGISPDFEVFRDLLTPQGALYFVNYATIIVESSEFSQNVGYSGIFVVVGSEVTITQCLFTEHNIDGKSVIGTFLSGSLLTMSNSNITNSSLAYHTDDTQDKTTFSMQNAVILCYTSSFMGDGLNFKDISLDGGTKLIFSNTASMNLVNTTIQNVISLQDDSSLIWLILGQTVISGLQYISSSSLLTIDKTSTYLSNITITNIIAASGTRFFIHFTDTTINIVNLIYSENYSGEVSAPIFYGSKANLVISGSKFFNVTAGDTDEIFYLEESSFSIYQTSFEYPENSALVSIFYFEDDKNVIIDSCTFVFAGLILQVVGPEIIIFMNNVIITNPTASSVSIQYPETAYIKNNCFIGAGVVTDVNTNTDPTSSLIQILDAYEFIALHSNTFISLSGQLAPVTIQTEGSVCKASISDNIFINNQGVTGASIYLSVNKQWSDDESDETYPQATIQDSIFLLNKVSYSKQVGATSGRGAAIFLNSILHSHQETILQGNIFINNSAQTNGGALFFDFSPPVIDETNVFQANYATQLNHIGSYPVKVLPYPQTQLLNATYIPGLTSLPQSEQKAYQWTGIPSGLENIRQYTFVLLDIYDQVVFDDYSSTLQVFPYGFSSDERNLFSSILSVPAQGGLYYYQNFIFNYKVSKKINVTFYSDAVREPDYYYYNKSQQEFSNFTKVEVCFRDCKFGEYLISSGSITKCQECQFGYWSIGKNRLDSKQGCTECDHTSTFCLGGSRIGPKPGYWRMNETSDIVTACANSDACLGNEIKTNDDKEQLDPTGKCASEFRGNMCNKCIPGYGKINGSECVNCKTSVWGYLQLSFILIFQIIILILGVKEVVEMTEKIINNNGQLSTETNGAILIRILVNYMQMVSLIADVPISWPSTLKSTLSVNVHLSFTKGMAISTDCFLQLGKTITSIREVFLSTSLTILTPIIFILLSIIFWIIYFKIRGREVFKNKNFSNQVIATVVIICFNLQPNVITGCFQLFQCLNLYRKDTPVNFLILDYDLQCWTHEHMFWVSFLGVPVLIVWGLGLPIFVYYVLRKNIAHLESIDFRKKYAFLYVGYRPEKCYWELFIILRKLLLICIIVFAGFRSVNLQIYLSVVLVTLSYIAQKRNKPYSNEQLNHLEDVSLISAGLINFCGLYFEIENDVPGLDFIFICVGVFGNFYFIIKFARAFLEQKIEGLKENKRFMAVAMFVWTKCCCCLRSKGVKILVRSVQKCIRSSLNTINRLFDIIAGTSTIRTDKIKPQLLLEVVTSDLMINAADTPVNAGTPFVDGLTLQHLKSRVLSFKEPTEHDELRRSSPHRIEDSHRLANESSEELQKLAGNKNFIRQRIIMLSKGERIDKADEKIKDNF